MNKFFKLLSVLIAITSISAALFYFYLKSTYTNVVSESNFRTLVTEIKSSKQLPDEFYKLYEIQYPESLSSSFNSVIFKSIFTDKIIVSPIQGVSKIYFSRVNIHERSHLIKQNDVSLSLNLNDEVSPKECLNWMVENGHTNTDKTIKVFMEEYYKKDIDHFNLEELAGIVAIMKNPVLYNPLRNKEHFETRVNMLVKIYQNKK